MKAQKQTELSVVALSPVDRAELALNSKKTEKELRDLVASVAGITAPTNAEGRQDCHAGYMSLRNARVAIESTGKKAREDATAFSKAVIAEEKKLVAIVDPEETRLKALRDEWDAAREAERQALIEAERLRVAALRDRIAAIVSAPVQCVGKFSGHITPIMIALESVDLSTFEELTDEAIEAHNAAVASVTELYHKAISDEAAERAAREAAEAEAARVAAEAERLAAESARLAAERAAFEAEQAKAAEAARVEAARLAAIETERAIAAKAEADRVALDAAIEAEKIRAEREAFEAEKAAFEAMLKATEAEKTPSVDAWFEPKATEAPVYSAHLAERLDEVDAMVDAMFDPVATVDEADAVVDSVFDPILERSRVIVDGVTLDDLTNAVCQLIPVGFILSLNMENGAAWVSLEMNGDHVELPDSSDKSIAEQLDDALAQSGVF